VASAPRSAGRDHRPFTSVHNMMPESAARYGVKPGSGNWTYHPELIPNFRPFYNNALTGGWVDAATSSGSRMCWRVDRLGGAWDDVH